jgi:hypothetical protein
MPSRKYETVLSHSLRDVKYLLSRRDSLNAELVRKLAVIRSAAALCGEGWNEEEYIRDVARKIFQPPTLPEAICLVLRVLPGPLAPVEIRDTLVEWGYDLRKYSFAMGVVHKCLKALIAKGTILVTILRDGSKLYSLTEVRNGPKG